MLANVSTVEALAETLHLAKQSGTPYAVIGGGSNLIVDDAGFPGVIIRYVSKNIEIDGERVRVDAGAVLQDLVDTTVDAGLRGLETMTGIPWLGGRCDLWKCGGLRTFHSGSCGKRTLLRWVRNAGNRCE